VHDRVNRIYAIEDAVGRRVNSTMIPNRETVFYRKFDDLFFLSLAVAYSYSLCLGTLSVNFKESVKLLYLLAAAHTAHCIYFSCTPTSSYTSHVVYRAKTYLLCAVTATRTQQWHVCRPRYTVESFTCTGLIAGPQAIILSLVDDSNKLPLNSNYGYYALRPIHSLSTTCASKRRLLG